MSTPTTKTHYGNLSPEFAVLGLLYGGPMHGYDLHKKLVSELGQVWHLSQSQAYAILKRLEGQGFVAAEEIPQEKLPPRQYLHLTENGRERFLEWLEASSGGSARAIRMEFITRLYFLSLHMPERLDPAFARQRADAEFHIQRLEAMRAGLPPEQIHNRMSLDLRILQLQSVLAWLDQIYQEPTK